MITVTACFNNRNCFKLLLELLSLSFKCFASNINVRKKYLLINLVSHGRKFDISVRPKSYFSVGVLNPRGIPIPMGFITPSQNQPKLDFSVGVINPGGIPIPMELNSKVKN